MTAQNRRGFRTDSPQSEAEADSFAIRLLAPACILWALNIHTPSDIARVCNIPEVDAKKRAEIMEVLYKRQKFLTNPLEIKVYEQFKPYIWGKQK